MGVLEGPLCGLDGAVDISCVPDLDGLLQAFGYLTVGAPTILEETHFVARHRCLHRD
jgi:hypothetical protein